MASFVRFENVGKMYHSGDVNVNALHDASFEIEKGEICIIVGQSGAGKTTLLPLSRGLPACAPSTPQVPPSAISGAGFLRLA